jgi:hypothetical protein
MSQQFTTNHFSLTATALEGCAPFHRQFRRLGAAFRSAVIY